MKKLKNIEWDQYRHSEFLRSLKISVNELKFIRLFLKRGTIDLINDILRERKTKQFTPHRNSEYIKTYKKERIKI